MGVSHTQVWSWLHSWVFVEEIKATIKCVQLIQQHGLTHDGGVSAFVACDILNCLPHNFNAVGVGVPLQCLLKPSLCLVDANFQSCSGSDIYFLVTWPEVSFFGPYWLSIHPGLAVGEWATVFVVITLYTIYTKMTTWEGFEASRTIWVHIILPLVGIWRCWWNLGSEICLITFTSNYDIPFGLFSHVAADDMIQFLQCSFWVPRII